jgi:hypothetical protein
MNNIGDSSSKESSLFASSLETNLVKAADAGGSSILSTLSEAVKKSGVTILAVDKPQTISRQVVVTTTTAMPIQAEVEDGLLDDAMEYAKANTLVVVIGGIVSICIVLSCLTLICQQCKRAEGGVVIPEMAAYNYNQNAGNAAVVMPPAPVPAANPAAHNLVPEAQGAPARALALAPADERVQINNAVLEATIASILQIPGGTPQGQLGSDALWNAEAGSETVERAIDDVRRRALARRQSPSPGSSPTGLSPITANRI